MDRWCYHRQRIPLTTTSNVYTAPMLASLDPHNNFCIRVLHPRPSVHPLIYHGFARYSSAQASFATDRERRSSRTPSTVEDASRTVC